jgi:hypothetical protein
LQTALTRADRDPSVISNDYASPEGPHISINAPSDASSRTFSYRPSHMRSFSASQFADSEAVSEDISGFASDISRPVSRAKSIRVDIPVGDLPAQESAKTMVDPAPPLLSTRLERIVSTPARCDPINPGYGIEFLHAGHDEVPWVTYKRKRRQERGIVRRWVSHRFHGLELTRF